MSSSTSSTIGTITGTRSGTRSGRRHGAALAVGVLVAGLMPVVLTAAPADAADACLADDSLSLLDNAGCDDVTPPDTEILSTGPGLNSARYLQGRSATFTFRAVVSDADTGPWSFMCRLDGTSEGEWQDCSAADDAETSTVSYPGLPDLKGEDGGYTFRVYAIDKSDAAMTWSDTRNPLLSVTESASDDDSASPATAGFKVDTLAPNSFIFDEPYDALRPELPMITARSLSLLLDSTESRAGEIARFVCTLDRAPVPCQQGPSVLRGLIPGDKRFTAAAVDLAGNRDPSPAATVFAVPRDLSAPRGTGWRSVKGGSGYFGGDYLESRVVGSTIVTKPVVMRELRLIAPAGPNLGTLDVRIGQGIRRTVRLTAPTYERFHVYVIRTEFSPTVGGRITLRVKSLKPRQVVRVDAILAH